MTDDTIARITDLIFAADPRRGVDVVIVLGSPNPTASIPAQEMYHAGLTPWIVVSGHGREGGSHRIGDGTGDSIGDGAVPEWQIHRDALLAAGVPAERILVEPRATNTLENITLSAALIADRLGWANVTRVGLCCKPIHARRARLTAQSHLPPGLSLSVHCPSDPQDIQPETWWQTPLGLGRVMGELRRIADYVQKGDLRLDPPAPRRHAHLLGIAGSGMRALARLYLDAGWTVSGSDRAGQDHLDALAARGALILAEGAAPPAATTLVVHSPAIPRSHPALVAARKSGLPIAARTKALTDLLAGHEVISVAGSHGKSTTTAMLALILTAGETGAGYMLGGLCESLPDGIARLGQGTGGGLLVAETCEAFRALDHWHPAHCLVTNVDDEHSEHYATPDALRAAFADLVGRVPEDGAIALCGDDPTLAALAATLGDRVLSFGTGPGNRVRPEAVRLTAEGCTFRLVIDDVGLGEVDLAVPGLHNLRNALGALAMAVALGIDPETACAALARFRPVHRRWQQVAQAHSVRVYDDFAHHPTEIEATLTLARQAAGRGRVLAVVEPQMISRVTRLAEDYATALALADQVWLLPLSPAGEVGDIPAAEAALNAALANVPPTLHRTTADTVAGAVCSRLRPGDVVVCMGPDGARRAAGRIAAGLADMHTLPPDPRSGARSDDRSAAPPPATPPQGALLHHRFDAQVAAQPEAICAVYDDQRWTYARMATEAGAIATALAARGIGPGDLVAVSMRKSLGFVAALLGISKAGAAFVPVDPRMTRADMGRVLRRAGARLTLTDDPWRARLAGFDAPLTLDDLCAGSAETAPKAATPRPAAAGDLAYGIFTSGSTGVPRLVGIEHRNIVSYFDQCLGRIFRARDYRLMPVSASISFDAVVHQVFCTLSLGGTTLLVEDLSALATSPYLDRVTLIGGTPSTLRAFLDARDMPPSVGTVNLGGEPVPPELLDRLRRCPGVSRVWNIYGPAETTMIVFAAQLTEAPPTSEMGAEVGRWIGRPFPLVRARLVDGAGNDVAPGTAGALLIGGPTVGRGYLGAPKQTASRFFDDPPEPGLRWYRSGDILRQLADGSYVFLGREDDQIKVNGVRIEPGEVRAALMGCRGVRDAAVLPVDAGGGRKQTVAFVVLEAMIDAAFLREWMRQHHAPILSPHRIVALPALPVQVNGKLDRQALLALAAQTLTRKPPPPQAAQNAEPADDVLAIWRDILGRDDLNADDDFRAAGGDSLAAMEIIMAVEEKFDIRLPPDAMDALTTPAAMLRALGRPETGPASTTASAPAQPDLAEADPLHRQKMFVAAWSGTAARPGALLRSLNPGGEAALFWVFQGNEEFTALAAALGPRVTLHGMRSGHQSLTYSADTIALLAETYADEIMALPQDRPVALGGNCQGAVIARATAFALRQRGRDPSRLILMEMAKPWAYDAPVDLIYGQDSTLNPYRKDGDPSAVFAAAFPQGFTSHFITGTHGAFFQPPNVTSLASVLRGLLFPGDIP